MTSSAYSSREMTPNRVHELAYHSPGIGRLIPPIMAAAAYATYQIYNKFKKSYRPKRNMTMSKIKNRF